MSAAFAAQYGDSPAAIRPQRLAHMKGSNMSNWVSKQINAGRKTSRLVLHLLALFMLLHAALVLFSTFALRLEGLDLLDSAEKIERFLERGFYRSRLAYTRAHDTYSTFGIATTLTGAINSGGARIPLTESGTSTVTYRVWYLEGEGYSVLYATPGDAPVTAPGTLYVFNDVHDLDDELRQMYAPDQSNVYVFYKTEQPGAEYYVTSAILFSVALLMLLIARAPFFERFTKLGRRIAALGDYRQVRGDLKRQSKHPLFASTPCLILNDYTLLREGGSASKRKPPRIYRNTDLEQCVIARDAERSRDGVARYDVIMRFAGMPEAAYFRVTESKKPRLEQAVSRMRGSVPMTNPPDVRAGKAEV